MSVRTGAPPPAVRHCCSTWESPNWMTWTKSSPNNTKKIFWIPQKALNKLPKTKETHKQRAGRGGDPLHHMHRGSDVLSQSDTHTRQTRLSISSHHLSYLHMWLNWSLIGKKRLQIYPQHGFISIQAPLVVLHVYNFFIYKTRGGLVILVERTYSENDYWFQIDTVTLCGHGCVPLKLTKDTHPCPPMSGGFYAKVVFVAYSHVY